MKLHNCVKLCLDYIRHVILMYFRAPFCISPRGLEFLETALWRVLCTYICVDAYKHNMSHWLETCWLNKKNSGGCQRSNNNLMSTANGKINDSCMHLTYIWFELQHITAPFLLVLAWLLSIDAQNTERFGKTKSGHYRNVTYSSAACLFVAVSVAAYTSAEHI